MLVGLDGLSRYHDDLAMKLAMEPRNILMHGLRTAVGREVAGTDINAAASGWVAKGYLAQADADEIAALVTARDQQAEPVGE